MVKPRYTKELNLASKYSITCILLAWSQLQIVSFGEIGFYILDSCLIRLFPNDAFLPGSTSPLSAADFRTFVLLPEVAVRLIMQDLSQDRATAIGTLKRSIKYGDSRFILDFHNEVEYDLSISDACRNIHVVQSSEVHVNKRYNSTAGISSRFQNKRNSLNNASLILVTGTKDVDEGLDDGPAKKRQRVAEGSDIPKAD